MRNFFLLLLLTASQICYSQTKQNITLEDIWKNGTFRSKDIPGFNALKDGIHYTQLDADSTQQRINVYSLATGKKDKTMYSNAGNLFGGKLINIEDYSFSQDEQKILLLSSSQPIYRRSILHSAYVYDIKKHNTIPVDAGKVLHPTFSPDGSKVAYVKDNNLYIKDLESGNVTTVTTDGEKNKIINGNCDWVYEEEFEFTRAFDWSGDGKYLAYYRFDESQVPEYTIPMYDSLYPAMYTYKYPKAGKPNSIVQIKIYDVAKAQTVPVNTGKETTQYIPRIKWTENPEKLCVYRLNRLQNKLELLLADAHSGKINIIYKETSRYYIDINDNLKFLPDGKSFIFNSERSGYNHLYKWDWENEKLTSITKGDFDIDQLVSIDKANHLVYYTAAAPTPMQRRLYAADWNGRHTKCLTPERGTHTITPCQGNNYFLDKYSKLNTMRVYYLRNKDGDIIRTLEDNHALIEKMQNYSLGNVRFVKLKGVKETLNGWMMTPPDFDSAKKYPVLMYQYSGPGSQEVIDAFFCQGQRLFLVPDAG